MRTPLRVFSSLAIAALLVAAVANTAFAGKPTGSGGTGGSSTLQLVLLNSTDGLPHHSQDVTFDVSTTETDQPMVYLKCYQGSLVYSFSAGYYPTYPWTKTATLRSQLWTGGAADCTATLQVPGGKRPRVLKTLSFAVAA